jgi:hypothetical protein
MVFFEDGLHPTRLCRYYLVLGSSQGSRKAACAIGEYDFQLSPFRGTFEPYEKQISG